VLLFKFRRRVGRVARVPTIHASGGLSRPPFTRALSCRAHASLGPHQGLTRVSPGWPEPYAGVLGTYPHVDAHVLAVVDKDALEGHLVRREGRLGEAPLLVAFIQTLQVLITPHHPAYVREADAVPQLDV
jgi:hypothetical protein